MRALGNTGAHRGATRLQCFGMVLAGMALASPLKVGVVDGPSMEPAFQHRQVYLMDRTHYLYQPVRRGDVVVFRKDGEAYIKRVVAVPGDMIYLLRSMGTSPEDFREDLVVSRFQLPVLKRAIHKRPWADAHKLIRRRIPEGYYYVLGDNRGVSIDSRKFGLVSQDEIVGHVLFQSDRRVPGEAIAGRLTPQPRS